jgi:exosortase
VRPAVRVADVPAAARPGPRAAAVAAALALGAVYAPVLAALVQVWWSDRYYSHAFLVPVFSGYLAWEARGVVLRPRAPAPRRGRSAGAVLALLGLVLLGGAALATSLTLAALSLPLVLGGAALGTLGTAGVRPLAFPIGFLVFMAPLPDGTLAALSPPLQHLAAVLSGAAVAAAGLPVARAGLVLHLPSLDVVVTEACNGLRFLLAMTVVGVAVAATTQRGAVRRAAVVALAVLVALLANVARVTGTAVLGELWGAEAAEGFFHLVYGKVVYGLALVPFLAAVVALRRGAPRRP